MPCTYHDYNYDYEKYLQIILSLVGNCLLSVLASNLLRVIRRLKLTAICFEPLLRVNMKAYGKNSENTFLFGIFLFLKNLLCRRSCINGGLWAGSSSSWRPHYLVMSWASGTIAQWFQVVKIGQILLNWLTNAKFSKSWQVFLTTFVIKST